MTQPHFLIIDASGFAHRAFYAHAHRYRSDGLPTWATLGFMGMVYALLERAEADPPTHAVAVFDAPGQTFRHKMFKDYKANRPDARRKELKPQLPFMRHAALALGLGIAEKDGFEADDVIATLATNAARSGWRSTIVSSDKDFHQLVHDGVVEIVDPVKRVRILEKDVKAKFGVAPNRVRDVQALWGDSADNIPGVDGVGGKIAGQLIARFGTLENLLTHAGQSGTAIVSPTIKRRLHKHAADIALYKKLATLRTAVQLDVDLESFKRHPVERDHLKEMLRVLEAADRFGIMFGGDPGVTLRAAHMPAPLRWWHSHVATGAMEVALSEIPRDPQDGYFKRRLVKGGPWVAGRIWRTPELDFVTEKETGFDLVRCEVDGKPRHVLRHWEALARFPISKAEFDHLGKVADWAKTHAPSAPEASPTVAIDLAKVKSIPNPRHKGKINV